MWVELVIRKGGAELPQHVMTLFKKRTRVGRSLQSDVFLLDRDIAPIAGKIERNWATLRWVPENGGPSINLWKQSCALGPYEMHARVSRKCFLWASVILAVLFWLNPAGRFVVKHVEKPVPQSIPADIWLPAREAFGQLTSEGQSKSPLRFLFTRTDSQGISLHFTTGNIIRPDQLRIEINGFLVGYSPLCIDQWGVENRWVLPTERLKFGTNEIRFLSRSLPAEDSRWGVRNIYITRLPRRNETPETPMSLFASAQRMFRERKSRTGLLFRSKQRVEKILQGFKNDQQGIPARVVLLRKEIVDEEERWFRNHCARLEAALAMKNVALAASEFDAILKEWPDPLDVHRLIAEKIYDEARAK